MRVLFICVALLAFLSPAAFAGDEQDIKDQLTKFSDAWAKDDMAGIAAVMTEDASLINPVGVYAKGRDEIMKVMGSEHAQMFKATKYVIGETKFQPVSADVMVVDLEATVTDMKKPDGSAAPDFAHHVTWVFVKKDGKWLGAAARPYKVLEAPAPKM